MTTKMTPAIQRAIDYMTREAEILVEGLPEKLTEARSLGLNLFAKMAAADESEMDIIVAVLKGATMAIRGGILLRAIQKAVDG